MSKRKRRWSSEFKQAAVARMDAAERIGDLAAELGMRRELLFRWRRAVELGGVAALRPPGRSSKPTRRPEIVAPAVTVPADLATARQRIEQLERKIGQQQLDLDFFRAALRQVREPQPMRAVPGETTSTA